VLTAGFEYFKQEGVCTDRCKPYPWSGQSGPGRDEKGTPECASLCDKKLLPATSLARRGAVEDDLAGGAETRYIKEKAERVLVDYTALGWGKDAAHPLEVNACCDEYCTQHF
jgi:hypothetical protein